LDNIRRNSAASEKAYLSGLRQFQRGLKMKTTPMLTGYQIYHNYIREHQGIGNLIPAEMCGIKVEGKNKWITLIQNAKKNC
jgi:hypothetical protein